MATENLDKETSFDRDREIQTDVELEDPVGAQGPSCEIIWEDGQAVVQCETPEDAELAAELLTLAPVRVVTKTPLERSSPSEEPSEGQEDSA